MKYTEHLVNSFYSSVHTGTITGADIVNRVVSKETGDAVKLYLIIEDGLVKDAKFQACGSVVLFASLSAIMDIIIGNTLENALTITEKNVIKEIKQVNRCDYSMVAFAVKALHLTLNNYLKRLEKGTINKSSKPARVRALNPAKAITVYTENDAEVEVEFETAFSEMLDETPVQKQEVQKAEVINVPQTETAKSMEEDVEDVTPELEIEEDITPVVLTPNKSDVIESVPTKIEVRILDEEEPKIEEIDPVEEIQEEIIPAKSNVKAVASKPDYISADVEEHEKNEDVIDEIDSITAKLTDAITKLNFKFDVDGE